MANTNVRTAALALAVVSRRNGPRPLTSHQIDAAAGLARRIDAGHVTGVDVLRRSAEIAAMADSEATF